MISQYISSPMNYIGGKYKLLPQLFPLFPENVGTLVDLFCGGANVGVNATADKIIFNDNLVYLVDLYNAFLQNPLEVTVSYVENRIAEFNLSLTNQEGYLKLRDEYNIHRNPLDLFILVAFSFNHQIRFNNHHKFNCPFGRDRSCYNSRMKNNLVSFIKAIQGKEVSFATHNFDEYDYSSLIPKISSTSVDLFTYDFATNSYVCDNEAAIDVGKKSFQPIASELRSIYGNYASEISIQLDNDSNIKLVNITYAYTDIFSTTASSTGTITLRFSNYGKTVLPFNTVIK